MRGGDGETEEAAKKMKRAKKEEGKKEEEEKEKKRKKAKKSEAQQIEDIKKEALRNFPASSGESTQLGGGLADEGGASAGGNLPLLFEEAKPLEEARCERRRRRIMRPGCGGKKDKLKNVSRRPDLKAMQWMEAWGLGYGKRSKSWGRSLG